MGGRLNGKCDGTLDRRHLRAQTRYDRADALRRIGARLVRLEADDEEGLIGRWDVVDEIQSDDRQHAFDARDRPDDVFDLVDHCLGAVDRDAFGKT